MKSDTDKRKKMIWRVVLVAGFVIELVLIGITIASVAFGKYRFPLYEGITFVAIAVWIYIAFLKQRSIDISKFVVDEKIKTHALVENLREGVMVVDSDNRVLVFNSKASEVTGLAEIECLGKDIGLQVDSGIGRVLKSGQEGETEGKVTTTGRQARFSVRNLPSETQKDGYRLIYIQAPQKASLPQKTTVSGGQTRAAELIKLMGDELGRLLDGTSNAEKRQAVACLVIRGLAEQLMLSAEPVCAGIRETSLRGSLQRADLSIRSLLKEVMKDITGLASAAEVNIDFPSDKGNDLVFNGDADVMVLAVRQILYNAVLESIPAGSVVVRAAEMGANIGLAIIDKGAAVPEGAAEHLFDDPYQGIPHLDGEKIRAAGTGLFLARGIVEAHRGTLVAESPGEGGLRVMMMLPGR